MIGIKQPKGHVHLQVGDPLTEEEIREASFCDKNDRYQSIRHAVDRRVIEGYKLWKTNYMAYDLLNKTNKYAREYTMEDLEKFEGYLAQQIILVESTLDRGELMEELLKIYSNPVSSKENL